MNGVGAGFVVGLLSGQVARDILCGELGEVHEGGFDEIDALGVWQANQGDAGEHGVGAAGESLQHVVRVFFGTGFAEDAIFQRHDGIGCEDDGGTDGAGGDEFGFGGCEAGDVIAGGFFGKGVSSTAEESMVRGSRRCEEFQRGGGRRRRG